MCCAVCMCIIRIQSCITAIFSPYCKTMTFIIFFILVLQTSAIFVVSLSSNITDQHALLSFKASITSDPSGVLNSWNNSIHFCRWTGVTCSLRLQRVTSLNLSSQHLVGTLSSHIGNLSFLTAIYLRKNNFHGSIPNEIGRLSHLKYLSLGSNSFQGGFPANLSHCINIRNISMYNNDLQGKLPTEFSLWSKLYKLNLGKNQFTASISPSIGNLSSLGFLYLDHNNLEGAIPNEIGRLFHLQVLGLGNNFFQGEFPANLSHCINIRNITLSNNNLDGELPAEFSTWPHLYKLHLTNNHFTGTIPPSIGNISSLHFLRLGHNNLVGGIPSEVAHHTNLQILVLGVNKFQGTVPHKLYNISSLYTVSLVVNEFEGSLPSDLGFTLPNLRYFYAGENRFSGPLPPSIMNASNIVIFDIPQNNITGPVPMNFGSLSNLKYLNFGLNPLGDIMRPNDLSFFNSLVNCTHLKHLDFSDNGLRGEFPNSIVNLSTTIDTLLLYGNYMHGTIPRDIGKLVNMIELSLHQNFLTGTIPESIGELSKLGALNLGENNISGVIPASISNITQLSFLSLQNNMLQGSMPIELFNISTIHKLFLANNSLSGVIPEQIVFSSQCVFLHLDHNLFTGPLPSNIGSLKHLVHLSVSNNKLSGDIPATLGNCVMLEELHMERNLFKGRIPSSFKSLKSLAILDLSNNNLSGSIPHFFDGFRQINFLNLSHNKLGGEVPKNGLFSNVSAFSVVGNSQLCGGIEALDLHACPVKVSRNKKKTFLMRIIFLLVLVPLGILLACLAFIWSRRRNSRQSNDPFQALQDTQYLKLSYQDLLLATNKFSANNLVGEGRYGSVYKGFLKSVEHIIAVKVLHVEIHGANKSFLAECEMLRNIRHRNLIKIITACSSTDFKGNDFKALVFEFMTNGSVDNWLHPNPYYQGNERNLTLLQRLNISIDVALGVDYLHHHSHTSIIHCDIKPSNILLDEDFVAYIGDFGLARFLFSDTSDSNQGQMGSTGVRGTVGYVPPEYGMCGEISTEGDVYSYGILLLEMFTGKRPTENNILIDGATDLHDYVRKALPQRVMDIADPRIVTDQREHGSRGNQSYNRAVMEECLASIFEVGILCSEETPRKRLDISVAIKQLQVARDKLLQLYH